MSSEKKKGEKGREGEKQQTWALAKFDLLDRFLKAISSASSGLLLVARWQQSEREKKKE